MKFDKIQREQYRQKRRKVEKLTSRRVKTTSESIKKDEEKDVMGKLLFPLSYRFYFPFFLFLLPWYTYTRVRKRVFLRVCGVPLDLLI